MTQRLNRHGEPYKSIQAARSAVTYVKSNEGLEATPIEIEGGFAIDVDDGKEDAPVETPRRTKRIPIGTRNILTAPPRKGFKRRFVNIDEDKEGWDRVHRFLDAGYQVVEGDVEIGDKRITQNSNMGKANIKTVGGGIKAVLMEIREDWYEEDQLDKQADIAAKESTMVVNENNPGEGQYGKVDIGERPG